MSFALIGNERVRDTVNAFIVGGRIPHALIITGETGLGKHTLARHIAKAAVCEADIKPCGNCRGCKNAQKDIHPDIIFVKREKDKKELGVKVIREVRSDAFIIPHEADRKVFIIEEAERMNASAQNALLKILEEPPERVLFILLCSSASAMLPTVLSRCVKLSLSPVETEEAVSFVASAASCDEQKAEEALKNARGNIGRALSIVGKGEKNNAKEAASAFIDMLFEKNEYAMLKTLSPFEKDRAATDLFFSELKAEICERVKALPKNGRRARALCGLFADIDGFGESAKLNANLSLLFCDLTAAASDYMR